MSSCIPDKSKNDYRNYRIVTLSNGIKTLLISDVRPANMSQDGTQLAAAALSIHIGSFADPSDVLGLAHFLEHMLFMGSEKYPDENEYDTYIKSHGGSDNASTDYEKTTYQFDIQPEYFEGALDRFSQFFRSPLLRENAVEREIKAVDSEFKNNLPYDGARVSQILAHIAKKEHPYSKFSWGNSKSLSELPKINNVNVMAKLRQFFEEYSRNNMTLALIAPETLDNLEEIAKKYLSDVKCRPRDHLEVSKFDNPYDMIQFHKLYHVVSTKDTHTIDLRWVVPPLEEHYKAAPESYITWLLGHECKGSVYSELRHKGYATGLSAWTEYWSMFSIINCSVELTEEGRNNIEEVVHSIFQYISMLQRYGASKDIYDQLEQINTMYFNYLDIDEPVDYVEDLVDNMRLYAEEDYISGPILLKEYYPKLIEEIQSYLTPESVNIIFLSKHHDVICSEEEPWFSTKYAVTDIPHQWIDKEQCNKKNLKLHLPERNRFIAENFDLKVDQSWNFQYPQMIHEDENGKIWFKPDKQFLLPKAKIYFKLISRIRNNDAYHYACCDMMDEILEYNMVELTYEADVAQIELNIEREERYVVLEFDGFTDKLQLFFQNVMEMLNSFDFTEKIFNIIKEKVRKQTRNRLIKAPKFIRTLRLSVLQKLNRNHLDILKELPNITPQKLKDFAKEYLSELYIESLFQGNITEKEACSYQNYVRRHMKHSPLKREYFPKHQTLKLPVGRTLCRHFGFNKKDPNSVIKNYFQIGPCNDRHFTIAKLLDHVIEEPIFDVLRTKEQLGYTVYSEVHVTGRVLGFSVTVQTEVEKYNADYVDEKICAFLESFANKLQKFSDEEYKTYVQSFIKNLQQVDLTLNDEASRNWAEIAREDYMFDMKKRMVEETSKINKTDILKFLHKYLLDPRSVRMLCVQIIGQKEKLNTNGSTSESETDSSDESEVSDNEDDDTDDGDVEVYPDSHFEINLLNVSENSQYTHVISDLDEFRKSSEYYNQLSNGHVT